MVFQAVSVVFRLTIKILIAGRIIFHSCVWQRQKGGRKGEGERDRGRERREGGRKNLNSSSGVYVSKCH